MTELTIQQVVEIQEGVRQAWASWYEAIEFARSAGCPNTIIRDISPLSRASRRSILWRATHLRNIVEQAIDKGYSREAAR